MSTPLRVLIVEDSKDDTLLLVQELRRGGYDPTFERVETPAAMSAALNQQTWNIVISDYAMPHFSAPAALALLKESGFDLPFIIMSGAIGEETAVEVMKAGAHDYVKKGNLARLTPAIKRELRDADVRRQHKRAEDALRRAHDELEIRVQERTTELAQANEALRAEIAERKRVAEALRESEEKYRTILESIEDGYFEVDLAGNLTFFNDSLCRIIGYPRDEMMGMNRQYLDEKNAEKVLRSFNGVYATGEPSRGFGWEIVRKDGTKRLVEASVSPIRNSEGEPIGFRGIARDITERKTLEMQLAQAQKLRAIGQLAAGVAHEINTPIQYVGDNTRFLQNSFADLSSLLEKYHCLLKATQAGSVPPELVAEVNLLKAAEDEAGIGYLLNEIPIAIQQSLAGIAHVAEIVRAMRDFSPTGTDEKMVIDVSKAIENTITVARNEWKHVAEVETDFDAGLPPVPCLPGEFNQVILSMLINAAHAIADVEVQRTSKVRCTSVCTSVAPPKGTITISTHHDGDWAEIRIGDTGMGIPEEVQPRIFDPFFTTKDVGQGTGQGLAIAHNVVVEKHGGTITFETEVGKGTTFIIRLPIWTR